MYRSAVPSLQVGQLTCQYASTGRQSQAPDEPSRAPFATQSATRIDLVAPSAPRCSVIDDPLCRQYGTSHRASPAPPRRANRLTCPRRTRPPGRVCHTERNPCVYESGQRQPSAQHSPGWSARLASSWRWLAPAAWPPAPVAGDGGERHDARLGRAVVGLADGAEQAGARGRVDDPRPCPALRSQLVACRLTSRRSR